MQDSDLYSHPIQDVPGPSKPVAAGAAQPQLEMDPAGQADLSPVQHGDEENIEPLQTLPAVPPKNAAALSNATVQNVSSHLLLFGEPVRQGQSVELCAALLNIFTCKIVHQQVLLVE